MNKKLFLLVVFLFIICIPVSFAEDADNINYMDESVFNGELLSSENLIPVEEKNYTDAELDLIKQRELDYQNAINSDPWEGMGGIPEVTFNSSKNVKNIVTYRSNINTVLSDSGDVIRQGDTFKMYLKDVNNNVIAGMHLTITFSLDGNSKSYDVVTDYLGVGLIPINLYKRIYGVTYSFSGGVNGYNGCMNSLRLLVYNDSYVNTTLVVNPTSNLIRGEYIIAKLCVEGSNSLLNGKLLETNFSNNYIGLTTTYGIAYAEINYNSGTYTFNCEFRGDGTYNPSRVNRTITISNTGKTIATVTSTFGDTIFQGKSLIFRLNTTNSNSLSYKNIKIVLGSGGCVNYDLITDNYGDAYRLIQFSPGIYSLTYFFEGDYQYSAFAKTINLYVYSSLQYDNIVGNEEYTYTNSSVLYKCLASYEYCQVSNQTIRELAINITSSAKNNLEKAQLIQNWVKTNIVYDDYSGTVRGAVDTYNTLVGNCVDQSYLVNALCRSLNIPTRFKIIVLKENKSNGHCYSQVLIGGKWLSMDTNNGNDYLGFISWSTVAHLYEDMYTVAYYTLINNSENKVDII